MALEMRQWLGLIHVLAGLSTACGGASATRTATFGAASNDDAQSSLTGSRLGPGGPMTSHDGLRTRQDAWRMPARPVAAAPPQPLPRPAAPPQPASTTPVAAAPTAPPQPAPPTPVAVAVAAPPQPAAPTHVAVAGAPQPAPTTSVAVAVAAPTSSPAPPPTNEAEPPDLPKGTTVLQVGDSMAGALGHALSHELHIRGVASYLVAKASTFIPQWASGFDPIGRQLQASLGIYRPDLVVITLGGNEHRMINPEARAPAVRALANSLGGRPCIWIAAPLWPKAVHTGILDVIRDNCAPCVFVDTNAMLTLEVLEGDGIHPTVKERTRWAKFMIEWLRYNRDPNGPLPWSLKSESRRPPAASP